MKNLISLSVLAMTALPMVAAAGDRPHLTQACEEELALSALPARLRHDASVYTLTDEGYKLTRKGEGTFTCVVARNHDSSFIPQCADAEGADTVIPGIIAKAEWALAGMSSRDSKARFDKMAKAGALRPPSRPGINYMMSAFNLIWIEQQETIRHVGPHVMFYAPNLSNDDIGGSMRDAMGENRGTPVIIEEGIHGYMVSFVEHASESDGVAEACRGQVQMLDDAIDGALTTARIDAAIRAPHRTDQDRAQDESRKPREFLTFIAADEGDVVAEINAGGGYNARLLPTIVGESGRVYATNAEFVMQLFDGINDRLRSSVASIGNVSVSDQEDTTLRLPEAVDLAILNNNYHDLHWQGVDTADFNRSVYNALKPGGFFVVGDHQAEPGTGIAHVGSLHRIDESVVIEELEAAGFELVASSDFLANANDNRSLFVVDPAIRGNTDRFMLKFQRPE